MARWLTFVIRAGVSATTAAATAAAALALVAKAQGTGVLRPINATSHWLHGPCAAWVRQADLAHTGVGYATHLAATVFWAVLFEAWIGPRRPLRVSSLVCDAATLSAVAAAVDYLATPKRFTPGWELVLSRRAMAETYAAMAAGLAIGVAAVDRAEAKRHG